MFRRLAERILFRRLADREIFERFTDRAQKVVALAQEEARSLNHYHIGTEHILLGLIREGDGIAAMALKSFGISLEAVRHQVEEIIGQGQQAPSGQLPFTPGAKKVLKSSLRDAKQLGHKYIGTEHILLGLIREDDGVALQVLFRLGADLNRVRQRVVELLHGYMGKAPVIAGTPAASAPPAWGKPKPAEQVTAATAVKKAIEQPIIHDLRDNDQHPGQASGAEPSEVAAQLAHYAAEPPAGASDDTDRTRAEPGAAKESPAVPVSRPLAVKVGLVLRLMEFAGPTRWRWLLTEEETACPIADHQVNLDESAGEYRAFTDLYRYLRWNAVPDRRTSSEAEIVDWVGAWAGRDLLGLRIGDAIVNAAPVTLRIEVPAAAQFVLGWPLELAHAVGKPLAARGDVTIVYHLATDVLEAGRRTAEPAPGPLRMLAVFSLPTDTTVLALRRERYQLARLIRRIVARERREVELRLVQYGATRDRLAEIVDSGSGWDVLHLSGHGGRGQFLLERADGSPDPVDTDELVRLLWPLRRRVRLAVVSACESAAETTAETLRWIRLDEQADQLQQEAAEPPSADVNGDPAVPAPQHVMAGIARSLVEQLGCAVVAMRYPVTDEFAIAFTEELYQRLLGRAQPLETAMARAVAAAAGVQPSSARPPISLATPVLIGIRAAGLRLEASLGVPALDPALVRMERFPPEPERFVGRARPMARASAALAAGSGRTGVLFHGMAGAGKTACAVELAYRHQDSFAAVAFWQAPGHADEFGSALAGLAAALDIQLGDYGFSMSDKITTLESLNAFLPRLKALLGRNGILIVLDNLETLLTGNGAWRDPRWTSLITALTGHGGESRVILTSRVRPAGLDEVIELLPVHALALDEAAALARELPGLRHLLHADTGPLRYVDVSTMDRDRDLVRRILRVVQGHPKLMELADAAASDPARLAAQVTAMEARAEVPLLDGFFRRGETGLDPGQFLDALVAWTSGTLAALPEPARLMAAILASMEDDDRDSLMVRAIWRDVWQGLGRAGDPPAWEPLTAALATSALIQPSTVEQDEHSTSQTVSYQMHPAIAEAIRAGTSPVVRDATDTQLGLFWSAVYYHAKQREDSEPAGRAIIHAGLAAAPYLIRRQNWNDAGLLLAEALDRDSSPVTTQAALPFLRTIAAATQAPEDLGTLAGALADVDPSQAEHLYREILSQAVAAEDFALAAGATTALTELLKGTGRLMEAVVLARESSGYTRRAGLGPWTQLADEILRLQILGLMGEHQQVLDEASELTAQMNELPGKAGDNETADPWNVRELLLDTAETSASALEDWQRCIELNVGILASMQARGASEYEMAGKQSNNAHALIMLKRYGEAAQVLDECQEVYEDHDDLAGLARVLYHRASLEDELGNAAAALMLAQTAIRYSYSQPDRLGIAKCHDSLANYLSTAGSDPAGERAHRLASILIYCLTGDITTFTRKVRALAAEMRDDTCLRGLPVSLEKVIAGAEQTEGVHLGKLIDNLTPDRQYAADALATILEGAADIVAGRDWETPGVQEQLQDWEEEIAATVAAAKGNDEAAAQLAPVLDNMAKTQAWAMLVAVLRRILDGERGNDLLDGLDEIDAAIAAEVLARIAAQASEHTNE